MATSETAREINRGLVLDRIRTGQPLSRADLARQTGLQRSTVSLIVDQLIAERWITEGDRRRQPRGRQPRELYLNSERSGVLGINLRPCETTIALADLNLRFLARETFTTGADPEEFVRELTERVCGILDRHGDFACEGIGVSLPGRVDAATGQIAFAPNLGWRGLELKAVLEQATGLPVEMENAANACALADAWAGPHAGVRDLIVVTVSEGIGTGIIANGQIVRGANGMAGEFGHVSLDPSGPACNCSNRGCWEVYASNSAALRRYLERMQGKKAASAAVNFQEILTGAMEGDAVCVQVLTDMAVSLGRGMAMLIAAFAPSVIVVVGEVTRAWARVGPMVEREVAEHLRTPVSTRIVPSDDSGEPRLRGTIALVLQKHFRPSLLG